MSYDLFLYGFDNGSYTRKVLLLLQSNISIATYAHIFTELKLLNIFSKSSSVVYKGVAHSHCAFQQRTLHMWTALALSIPAGTALDSNRKEMFQVNQNHLRCRAEKA